MQRSRKNKKEKGAGPTNIVELMRSKAPACSKLQAENGTRQPRINFNLRIKSQAAWENANACVGRESAVKRLLLFNELREEAGTLISEHAVERQGSPTE